MNPYVNNMLFIKYKFMKFYWCLTWEVVFYPDLLYTHYDLC
jgi:hypothetical protein